MSEGVALTVVIIAFIFILGFAFGRIPTADRMYSYHGGEWYEDGDINKRVTNSYKRNSLEVIRKECMGDGNEGVKVRLYYSFPYRKHGV